MKDLFRIDESERERILSLHENATKNLYLSEQTPTTGTTPTVDPKQLPAEPYPSFDVLKSLGALEIGSLYLSKIIENPKKIATYWEKYGKNPENVFTPDEINSFVQKDKTLQKKHRNINLELSSGNPDDATLVSLGTYLLKNEDLLHEFYEMLKSKNMNIN